MAWLCANIFLVPSDVNWHFSLLTGWHNNNNKPVSPNYLGFFCCHWELAGWHRINIFLVIFWTLNPFWHGTHASSCQLMQYFFTLFIYQHWHWAQTNIHTTCLFDDCIVSVDWLSCSIKVVIGANQRTWQHFEANIVIATFESDFPNKPVGY